MVEATAENGLLEYVIGIIRYLSRDQIIGGPVHGRFDYHLGSINP